MSKQFEKTVRGILDRLGFITDKPCCYVRRVKDDAYHIGCTVSLAKRLNHDTVHSVIEQIVTDDIVTAIRLQDEMIDRYRKEGILLDSYRKGYQKPI